MKPIPACAYAVVPDSFLQALTAALILTPPFIALWRLNHRLQPSPSQLRPHVDQSISPYFITCVRIAHTMPMISMFFIPRLPPALHSHQDVEMVMPALPSSSG